MVQLQRKIHYLSFSCYLICAHHNIFQHLISDLKILNALTNSLVQKRRKKNGKKKYKKKNRYYMSANYSFLFEEECDYEDYFML